MLIRLPADLSLLEFAEWLASQGYQLRPPDANGIAEVRRSGLLSELRRRVRALSDTPGRPSPEVSKGVTNGGEIIEFPVPRPVGSSRGKGRACEPFDTSGDPDGPGGPDAA
jgi:hypothetical protein